MKKHIPLPDGKAGIFRMTAITPENGTVHLRRWDMVGAKATGASTLHLDGEQVVYQDLVPREVIFDGEQYSACVIGGLRTNSDMRDRGYATALLKEVIIELKRRGEQDLICNFILEERLTFFLERGWEIVDEDVKITVQQPGATVPLPSKFYLGVYRLKDSVVMPQNTVEYMGLPA